MNRVLITGSREWNNISLIKSELNKLFDNWGTEVILISGHCPKGADAICENIGKELGWTLEIHPADWAQYGKPAGFIRNKNMVDLGADICLAFIRNGSRGASSTAKLAEEANIKTLRFIENTI